MCFIDVRLVTFASIAVFSIAVTIICLNMLSFAFDRFDMVVYLFVRHPSLVVSYSLFSFVCVRFGVLDCGAFAFVLLLIVVVCIRSLPLAFV